MVTETHFDINSATEPVVTPAWMTIEAFIGRDSIITLIHPIDPSLDAFDMGNLLRSVIFSLREPIEEVKFEIRIK